MTSIPGPASATRSPGSLKAIRSVGSANSCPGENRCGMEIMGHPPELTSLLCQGFICEGFAYQDKPVANANVVHLLFADTWDKIVMRCGVVIWRQSSKAPEPWSIEEKGWRYPNVNVGEMAGVIG